MRVITPATDEPVSLALARKQCKVDATGSPPAHEDDDLIQLFVSAAREWCEVYLGRIVAPTTVEITLDEFPSDEITLESGPVLGVVGITYLDEDSVSQTVDPLTYTLDTADPVAVIRLNTDEEWPTSDASANNIRVQYLVGYSIPGDSPQDAPLPQSIRAAILLVTAHLYRNRESTADKVLQEIPMGARFLLSPFMLRKRFA